MLTADKAGRLAPEERLALLKKAALLADPEKQADILCGLISAMTQDELVESTRALLDAQRKGNNWSQEVWNTLWTQWGRVNAEACLALSKTGERYPGWNGLNGLNTPNDYRCLMAGWLETHPEAAMAWARQAKDNFREATGAAFAITSSANGDLKKMESAILSISDDKLTTRACFEDYFDLATSTGDKPQPSVVYDRLDPKLRAAAWPVVMERLTVMDSQSAVTWLGQHANDPGCDYSIVSRLAYSLVEKDPAATLEWAAKLPITTLGDAAVNQTFHPAVIAMNRWMRNDSPAATEWLRSQPANAPWVVLFHSLTEKVISTDN